MELNPTQQKLADTMARCRRRIARIKRLQCTLNTLSVTAQVVHEKASEQLFYSLNGHRFQHDLSAFTEDQAARATAELIAFDPLRKSDRRK